ncbi:MAG: fibronectin type III domain-containing protein [Flavobacteriaceae bacterium]|nr:fibronectin type III domain-containing protein [Flavobacteriaceae bacterium]
MSGFALGTGTVITTTGTPDETISGLQDSTVYDLYVTAVCDRPNNDFSTTLGPITFTTQCLEFSTPVSFNFDNFTVAANTNFDEELCWQQTPTGTTGYGWRVTNTNTGSLNTGPDAANSLPNYFFVETSSGSVGQMAELLSPLYDLSTLTEPALTFYYHMYGADMGNLHVDVRNVTAGTPFDQDVLVLNGQQQTSGSDPWIDVIIGLNAYAGDIIQVKFRGERGASFTSDMAIDDVQIDEAPSCLKPLNLEFVGASDTTATIAWTENGTATAWEVEYGLVGFAQGTGTIINVTTNPTTTIPGLSPETDYEFYVRADCGAVDGLSDWAGPRAFSTECAAVTSPYSEDFTSFTVATSNFVEQNCWEQPTTVNTGFGWRVTTATTPSANTGPSGPSSSPNYFYLEAGFPPAGAIAELISVPIDLTGLATPAVKFDYHMFGANIGALRVDVRNVTTGAAFDNDLLVITGQQQIATTDPWRLGELNLSAYAGDVIQLRFRGEHGGGTLGDIGLDDVRVEEATVCPQPINLDVQNITPTTADFFWTENGTATLWEVEIVLAGNTPTGTPTATPTAIPYPATGLLAATAYEFYVRADCGAVDGLSDWSGPFSFQTECDVVATPHVQNFNTFPVNAGTNIVEELCWEQPVTVSTGFGWRVNNTNTSSTNTGPIGAFVPPNYVFLETSAGTTGAIAELISPLFDLSTLTTPALKYRYHMFGAAMGALRVDVRNVTAGTPFDNDVFVLTGQQQTADTDPWELAEIGLSAYAGDIIQVRFRGERGTSFTSDMAIDDFRIEEATTCPQPINLGVQNITTTTADLEWTENGSATVWDVEWVIAGNTPTGTPSAAGVTQNPFTATNLSPATAYDFYVRADCTASTGSGGQSNWSGPFTFETLCDVIQTPHVQNFAGFTVAANTNIIEEICWVQPTTPTAGFGWRVTNTNTGSVNTGPDAAFVAPNYVFLETSGGAVGAIANLESPEFDLAPLAAPALKFHYHMYGADMGVLRVDIRNVTAGTPFDNDVFVLTGQQQTSGAAPWELAEIGLGAYAGDIIQVRFRGQRGAGLTSDMSIDDFRIEEATTCPQPINLGVSNITNDSADLQWTENGSATLWDVEVVLAGTTPTGTPTNLNPITAIPYTATNLLADTEYDFYVRADCGAVDGVSNWSGPFSFKTECDIFTTPHLEDFTTFTVAAFNNIIEENCWEQPTTVNTGFGWRVTNAATGTANTGPNGAFSAPNYVFLESGFPPAGAIAEFISPLFDLSTLTTPALKFHYHMFGADIGALRVDIRNVTAGTPFDNDVFVLTGQQQTSGAAPWVLAEVGLGAYAGDVIQVRFRGEHGGGTLGDIAMDDFRIEEATTCPQPINLGVQNEDLDNAELLWTENGSATVWDIEIVTSGTAPTGVPTDPGVTTNPFLATGLTAATQYDFYVRADCGPDGFSDWSGPFTFSTTICLASDICNYTFRLTDSFGDGWNGNTMNVTQNGILVEVLGPTFTTGTGPIDISVPICDGVPFELFWNTGGSFANEVGIEIIEPFGTSLFNKPPGVGAQGTQLFTGTGACTPPACPFPQNLTATNITPTSADLAWTEMGTATLWDVEWGLAGFTPAGTPTTGFGGVTATSVNLPGLTPATAYEFYVRADCGPDGFSDWSGPFAFNTLIQGPLGVTCTTGNPATIFTAEFDDFIGFTGSINTGTGVSNGQWNIRTGTTTSTGTGPSGAHSGANYAYVETSGGTPPTPLVTPAIDLSGAVDGAELSFWLHAFGSDIGIIDVEVGNSPTGPFTTEFSWTGQLQSAEADPYQNVGVDLTSYLGQIIYIRFNYRNWTTFEADLAIDLIEVSACGNFCPAPTQLAATNITPTTADLSWTENGSATQWDVEVVLAGAAPTGTPTGAAVGNPYTAPGLTAATAYDYYVRADCGGGDFSVWTGPFSFQTECDVITTPHTQDFSNFTVATTNIVEELCWEQPTTVSTGFGWRVNTGTTTSLNTGPDNAHILPNYIFLETSAGAVGNIAEFTSPLFDLSPLAVPALRFHYHMYGADMGTLRVDVRNVTAGTPFDLNVFSISGQQQTSGAAPWTEVEIDLAAYAGDEIQVRFRGERGTGFTSDMAIDNFILGESTLSTIDVTERGFSFYPNPVKDVLNIDSFELVNDVTVINMLGQIVVQTQPNVAQAQINLGNLSAGTYLVRVSTDEGTRTVRVIKE